MRNFGLLLFILLAGVAMGCDATGEGPKAERGYSRARPVIDALAQYRHAHGSYPDSLADLVPAFLPARALALPERDQEMYPLEYEPTDSVYVLSFRYVGPGMNVCRYASASGQWRCSGHF
jgi:hypothetical protein